MESNQENSLILVYRWPSCNMTFELGIFYCPKIAVLYYYLFLLLLYTAVNRLFLGSCSKWPAFKSLSFWVWAVVLSSIPCSDIHPYERIVCELCSSFPKANFLLDKTQKDMTLASHLFNYLTSHCPCLFSLSFWVHQSYFDSVAFSSIPSARLPLQQNVPRIENDLITLGVTYANKHCDNNWMLISPHQHIHSC